MRALLGPGRTAAMVGPSGVGKSSLANALAGTLVADTREIRDDGSGRHTTTARELHLLPGGGLLDRHPGHARARALRRRATASPPPTPTSPSSPSECRFRDCAHRTEPGCAVAAAIDDGRSTRRGCSAWRKLQAEARRQELRVDARARAAEHARLRAFARRCATSPTAPASAGSARSVGSAPCACS